MSGQVAEVAEMAETHPRLRADIAEMAEIEAARTAARAARGPGAPNGGDLERELGHLSYLGHLGQQSRAHLGQERSLGRRDASEAPAEIAALPKREWACHQVEQSRSTTRPGLPPFCARARHPYVPAPANPLCPRL